MLADPDGVDPDPTCKKNTDQDPYLTVKKKNQTDPDPQP